MGTTESSLYANVDGSAPDAASRPSHLPDDARRHSLGAASALTPARPTSIRRQRALPVVALNGVVLGLPGSGKRSLLQRLEGKEPFVEEQSDNVKDDPPRDITVPYQPPATATVWDRIHLNVQLKLNEHVRTDFCVILVNPKHDARSLQPYVARLVMLLLKQSQTLKRKLCLCFLLNFRDLQDDQDASARMIQCKDVLEWAAEILDKHDTSCETVILRCERTSLKNCYGLSSLHHFIYQSYLVHKEAELEQRLFEVQSQLNKSKQAAPTMTYDAFLIVLAQTRVAEPPSQERNASSTSGITSIEGPTASRQGTNNGEVRETNRQTSLTLSSNGGAKEAKADDRSRINQHRDKQEGPSASRSIMPKPYADPKQTLDAFFADDDDDSQEGIVTPVTSHHAPNTNDDSDDEDDDDDDDFFYDEGGQRHQHGHIVLDSVSDDEEDEVSIVSHGHSSAGSIDSKLAEARGHSILDSEDSGMLDEDSSMLDRSMDFESDASQKPSKDGAPSKARSEANGSTNELRNAEPQVDDENGWDEDDIELEHSDDDNDSGNGTHREPAHEQYTLDDSNKEKGHAFDHEGAERLKRDGLGSEGEIVSGDSDEAPSRATNPSTDDDPLMKQEVDQNGVKKDESGNDESVAKEPTPDQPASDETPASKDDPPNETGTSNAASDQGASAAIESSPDTHIVLDPDTRDSDLVKATEQTKAYVDQKSTSRLAEEEDDDDFIVEETSMVTQDTTSPKTDPIDPKVNEDEPSSSKASSSAPSTSGLSAAALAAIAAAEREAQLMMQVAAADPPTKMEKKKAKKKKDPDAKKKKKRHKEKRTGRAERAASD